MHAQALAIPSLGCDGKMFEEVMVDLIAGAHLVHAMYPLPEPTLSLVAAMVDTCRHGKRSDMVDTSGLGEIMGHGEQAG